MINFQCHFDSYRRFLILMKKICLKNCNFLYLTNNCSRKQQKKHEKYLQSLLSWHFNLTLCQTTSSPPSQISEEILRKKIQPETFFPARLWLLLCHCPLNIVAAVDIKRNNDETQKKKHPSAADYRDLIIF